MSNVRISNRTGKSTLVVLAYVLLTARISFLESK